MTDMSVSNEIRRTLSDPKPLYALAGAGDFAAAKLRDAPTLLTEAAATVTTLANRIAAEAPEQIAKVQARLAEVPNALAVDPRAVVGTLDPRTARESILGVVSGVDTQALRDKAQTIALIQVGRVLEAAGKAVETYDGLAERGKTVVERYRGAGDGEATDVTVVVEQVIVEEPEPAEPKAQTKAEPKSASASSSSSSSNAGTSRGRTSGAASSAKPQASQAKKTAATPRKRATSPNASKSTKA
jgi:heparin binding hemagglutinin HbhA